MAPDRTPVPKMQAVAVAGALITAIVGICAAAGIVIPEEVSDAALVAVTAIASVVTFVAGYLKKNV